MGNLQDIIKWLNDKSNRRLISYLLLLSGISSIVSGLFAVVFIGNGSIPFDQVFSYSLSFAWTAVFEFIFGLIFLILGIRLWKSAK